MPGNSFITIFDYNREVSQLTGHGDASFDPDEQLSHGCEICQVPLTIASAYIARFGTWRCGQCIGDDGFTTAQELEEFQATGITSCPDCGAPMPPGEVAADRLSCWYQCPACGNTARFSIRLPA
jgi:hypothetical protein